jgi:hypothetical protein
MDRRQMLRILGTSAAAIGLSPTEARALLVPGVPRRASRRFFTEEEREAVTVLADLIIPATDTPGAVEAGVVDYIELIVSEWLNAEGRDRFMRGLRHLDTHAEAVTGTGFVDADEAGQAAILTGLEAEGRALKDHDPDAPTPFFQQTRALVLHGYYTSEIGMREELLYEPFPDRFEGCVKVTEVTRAVPETRG